VNKPLNEEPAKLEAMTTKVAEKMLPNFVAAVVPQIVATCCTCPAKGK
jgi:hypothetical protein